MSTIYFIFFYNTFIHKNCVKHNTNCMNRCLFYWVNLNELIEKKHATQPSHYSHCITTFNFTSVLCFKVRILLKCPLWSICERKQSAQWFFYNLLQLHSFIYFFSLQEDTMVYNVYCTIFKQWHKLSVTLWVQTAIKGLMSWNKLYNRVPHYML